MLLSSIHGRAPPFPPVQPSLSESIVKSQCVRHTDGMKKVKGKKVVRAGWIVHQRLPFVTSFS
jgi:hypothetical protein